LYISKNIFNFATILILEIHDKFELEFYKFNKEKNYIDLENTMMILDRKKKKEY